MDKYGFSTTIPDLPIKSFLLVTTNAEALEDSTLFLYLGEKANVIDPFCARLISSTQEIEIPPSPTRVPLTFKANSLRVINKYDLYYSEDWSAFLSSYNTSSVKSIVGLV